MQASTEIQIRQACPPDAPAVARVLHDSFVEYETLYTPKGFAATVLKPNEVLARMREGPVWLAFRGPSDVVGTVAAKVKDHSLYMRGMAVVPGARGLGIGARLFQQVEAWASNHKCRCIFLSTTPFLDSAIRLYEKLGFRRTDEGARDLFGTPLFTMEKIVLRSD